MFQVQILIGTPKYYMNTILRDARQRPIGIIRTDANNNQRIFDKTGRNMLGVFNKTANKTYGSNGRLTGQGNLLQTKIKT